jgi:hypothetical protein
VKETAPQRMGSTEISKRGAFGGRPHRSSCPSSDFAGLRSSPTYDTLGFNLYLLTLHLRKRPHRHSPLYPSLTTHVGPKNHSDESIHHLLSHWRSMGPCPRSTHARPQGRLLGAASRGRAVSEYRFDGKKLRRRSSWMLLRLRG